MVGEALHHRSGRIIALLRVVLAALFVFALWVDPSQPVRDSLLGYVLLVGYLSISIMLLAIAWNNWWADHRLAVPAFAIDVFVFITSVYFTEGLNNDFTSPFLAFFAFLMLSSTIRWHWKATALAAGVICLLYFSVGLMMEYWAVEFHTYRFIRRTGYMVVMSLVLLWFGLERRGVKIVPFHPFSDFDKDDMLPLEGAVNFACGVTNAAGAAICWENNDEPVTLIYQTGMPGGEPDREVPDHIAFIELSAAVSCLFDARNKRQLYRSQEGRVSTSRLELVPTLAKHLNIPEGVALPLLTSSGHGQMIIYGIPGMCVDDLMVGEAIVNEIAAKFDRRAIAILERRAALVQTREAIARDLHDSVAQSLSAAAYRLEGLRKWISAGNDPEPEIDSLKHALHAEQKHVRGLIEGLRREVNLQEQSGQSGQADLGTDLKRILADLAIFWQIETTLHNGHKQDVVPLFYSHEIQQLVREAIANAVRHGGATKIDCELSLNANQLHLVIRDNGSGIAEKYLPVGPRSIRERVEVLGGSVQCRADKNGTMLDIEFPLGAKQ